MKINPFNVSNVNPYKRQQVKVDQTNELKANKADKVEISSHAKEMQGNNRIQLERQEKLDQIKNAIENGTYKANAKQTAADLLKHFRG